MKTKDKAHDLLSKMNGQVIAEFDWVFASEYAKNELKRKALIVCDEIIDELGSEDYQGVAYWLQVKQEIEIFKLP